MNYLVILFVGLAGLLSCTYNPDKVLDEYGGTNVKEAVCVLVPTEGSMTNGQVWFTQTDSGVHVMAKLTGLTPGSHGFHVHEYGDCSDPSGKSAGGHFNPEGYPHAGPDAEKRHIGDLGNIVADSMGIAEYDAIDHVLSLSGPHSIIGRAVIVHAGADDLISQPTGNAGARVACGVIGIMKDNE